MKHLTRNRAIRLPMLLVLVIFALATTIPGTSLASIDFTIGANARDGDPGDGLEYTGGGTGLGLFDESNSSSIVAYIIVVPPVSICPHSFFANPCYLSAPKFYFATRIQTSTTNQVDGNRLPFEGGEK